MTGKVKWFRTDLGYGFIATDDGGELFVHHTGVLQEGPKKLNPGDTVDYKLSKNKNGDSIAINVSIVKKAVQR